ncbi:MAG TPA: SGNH/GDSL hydrolase family protein [Pseudonocardiaceae bacterium]
MGRFVARVLQLTAAVGVVLGTVVAGVPAAHAQVPPPYTALGDSYTSGTGTRSYYSDGTNCQRSSYAFPVLDAQRLGAALTFAACAGARVADVQNSQLGSLNAGTRYITVQVGGNDAGFSNVITQCALPWPYTCTSQLSAAQSFIRNTLPGRLDGLYAAIRSRAPGATVVVVGYPRLFNGEECNPGARISPGEQSSLNQTADLLATTIAGRAAAHGFRFVDVRAAFTGHAVCDDVEWVNGLSNPVGESYHPNRGGHSAGFAPLVEAALRA